MGSIPKIKTGGKKNSAKYLELPLTRGLFKTK
jgi:hypothetical protein